MSISEEKRKIIQESRRKQILDAAILLFDQQGFSATKISDISEKAGISKGLVYRYFNSKEEILLALHENIEHCIHECFQIPSARDAITTFAMRLLSFPYYDGYGAPPIRVFFNAIVRKEVAVPDEINPLRENFGREYFGALFRRGQEQGIFKEGDSALFGDVFWKYMLGYLSEMSQYGAQPPSVPDIGPILGLFEKEGKE